jgi:hypothetical protein
LSLEKIQAELAALLMEPGRLEAFEADPKAFVRKAGLTGKDADLLAGLPVAGARYFAERRRIDRFGYLRGDLPHGVALVDREVGLAAYFDAHPYAFEEPMKEVARFARWASAAARSGALPRLVADVVRFEATAVQVLHRPHRAAKPGKRPRRAPGVRILQLSHDPEHFLHDHAWTPAPGRHMVALQRTADDVEARTLNPAELALLRAANGRRTEAALLKHVAAATGHTAAGLAKAMRRLRKLRLVA